MQNYKVLTDSLLVDLYQVGDDDGLEALLERYKPVVRKKAKAMYLVGGETEDLIQEGMVGLFTAVRDYDEEKEASFATFAALCINRSIMNAVTAANRQKNVPLNGYVSYEELVNKNSDNSDSDLKLLDIIIPEKEGNPECLYIDRENAEILRANVLKVLSPMEKNVLELYMQGMDYQKIAKHLNKPAKSIDNALQRIRNKVDKITNV